MIEPIQPMEPVLCEKPFDSPDHLFQIKWDGVRCLTYKFSGEIRLVNRRLNDRTIQYPELTHSARSLPDDTVIDGEVIVAGKSGKPDFYKVLSRDQLRSSPRIAIAVKALPVQYMVFDVLYHKGKSVMDLPLVKRQEILSEIVKPDGTMHLVDSIDGSGASLFSAIEREGMEGIVAKVKESPYIPGKKTMLWQKVKAWREIDTVICGYTLEMGSIRSLAVGIYEGEDIIYVGSIASGVTQAQWSMLQKYFESSYPPDYLCSFKEKPVLANVRWVKPEITVKVRFLEWSDDAKLRHPVVLDFTIV